MQLCVRIDVLANGTKHTGGASQDKTIADDADVDDGAENGVTDEPNGVGEDENEDEDYDVVCNDGDDEPQDFDEVWLQRASTLAHIHTNIHTHIHTYMQTSMHTHTHIHVNTHIHTQATNAISFPHRLW